MSEKKPGKRSFARRQVTNSVSTTVYLAPFHSSLEGYGTGDCRLSYKPLSDALDRNDWPYDTGDDPSFFSADRFGGNVTWGICRQQIRNRLNPGDIIIFFSFRKQSSHNAMEYSLCAVATVARKVKQTDIWTDPSLRVYRRYLNLLIRPTKRAAWEHFEPGLPNRAWHKDWASANRRSLRLQKTNLRVAEQLKNHPPFAQDQRTRHPSCAELRHLLSRSLRDLCSRLSASGG